MSRLFSMDRLILAYLTRLADETLQPTVNVSAAQIAAAIGSGSRRHVITCLDRLEDAGEIRRSPFVKSVPGAPTPPRSITLLKAAWPVSGGPGSGGGSKPTSDTPSVPSLAGGLDSEKGVPADSTRSEGQADICYVKHEAASTAASSVYGTDQHRNAALTFDPQRAPALPERRGARYFAQQMPKTAQGGALPERAPALSERRGGALSDPAVVVRNARASNFQSNPIEPSRAVGSVRSEEGQPDPTFAAPKDKNSALLGWDLAHEMHAFFGEKQIVKETANMIAQKRTTRAAVVVDWKGFREWHSEKIANGGSFIKRALCSAWRDWAMEARTSKKVAHAQQEAESKARHSIAIEEKRGEIIAERVDNLRDDLARRDYDDTIAHIDDLERRARQANARGTIDDIKLAEFIVRYQAARVRAEQKLLSSRGSAGGDDDPAAGTRVLGEATHTIETKPAAWSGLRLAQ